MAEANTIPLSPLGTYFKRERIAGAAGIKPGYMLELNASNQVIAFATPDAKPDVLRIADIDVGNAGTIRGTYASGDTVNYVEVAAGAYITLVLAPSQAIVAGDELTGNGAGPVKAPAVAGTGVVFIADEDVTTGVGETAFIRATVANF